MSTFRVSCTNVKNLTMPYFCEILPNVTLHNPCRVRGGGWDPVSLRERVFDDGTT